MEIFAPVFVALLLHSGIVRTLDIIQMRFVSQRVSDKLKTILREQEQENENSIDDEVDTILRILRGKEAQQDDNPEGEWRYLDDGK